MYIKPVLFMCYLGCKPEGRHSEQHDWFFSVGDSVKDIVPEIRAFWPEAAKTKKFHIDSYRQITYEKGYVIYVQPREKSDENFMHEWRVFFINLGGYRKDEIGECHYPGIYIAETMQQAIEQAKETAFFMHTGYPGAPSHIDDKCGIDVDEAYQIEELLPKKIRDTYSVWVMKATDSFVLDEIHSGFQLLTKFEK